MKQFIALICIFGFLSNAGSAAGQAGLKSRAEQTDYAETSRYTDVLQFIASMKKMSEEVRTETFAVTNEGRALPLVILSRPAITNPAQARQSGKPVVFIMANIHAGEVEGKEASLHLMRDVIAGPLSRLLDKITILVAPIYNADGNEKIDINNRTAQNGPVGGVGVRENAQRLDLNRDFMKIESPEARGLIEAVFNRWDPHVIIDLHTTNGSYHGYALTYAPPLNPNTDSRIISFLRTKLLPAVSKTLSTSHNYKTYYYGNFADQGNPAREMNPDKSDDPKVWATFDHRPRFGTNYVGLRNRLAILSEAYSYLDFRSRVDVTDKFVRAVLQYVADHARDVVSVVREADKLASRAITTAGNEEGFGLAFELIPSPQPVEILVGSVTRAVDPRTSRPRFQATSEARPVLMTEYGQFRATRRIKPPAAYILKPEQRKAVDLLLAHGVTVEVMREARDLEATVFDVKQITRPPRAFQGHRESKLTVSTAEAKTKFPAGSFIVPMNQPKAALVFYLLEPESDDGLANWNFFDEQLDSSISAGSAAAYPVYRLKLLPRVPREPLKTKAGN